MTITIRSLEQSLHQRHSSSNNTPRNHPRCTGGTEMPNNIHDHVKIESPCNADWESMIGNDRVRFCKHCNLNVNDIDNFTSKELRRLLLTSRGRICFRYRVPAMALPRLHQIVPRRVARFAAGAFSAALSLSTAAVQQANATSLADSPSYVFRTIVQPSSLLDSGSVTGTITSQKGAPIDGATVTLSNGDKNLVFSASTDAAGRFSFQSIESGYYDFNVQAPGYSPLRTEQLFLRAGDTTTAQWSLSPESLETAEIQGKETSRVMIMGGGMAMLPT